MAHFAEIGLNNVVLRVIVIDNGIVNDNGTESEALGVKFCRETFGGTWLQTSYNSSFRKNFASTGSTYDPVKDAFIPPKLKETWILNESTCQWEEVENT